MNLNLLKRRFESFTGIGYNNSYVSSGLDRLGNFDGPYTQEKVQNLNKYIIANSNDRAKMFNNWFNMTIIKLRKVKIKLIICK